MKIVLAVTIATPATMVTPVDGARSQNMPANDVPESRVRLTLVDPPEGSVMWRLPLEAPFEQDIELAVIDDEGVHALVFPCQRLSDGWIDATSGEMVDIHPTHWRPWQNCWCDGPSLH